MDSVKGELVSFNTKDGLVLRGFLIRPVRKSDRAVIHVHGLEGGFYRSHYADVLARKLAANGFNYLTIEQRGSYTAVGIRRKRGSKGKWLTAGGGFEVFEDCVYDIDGAIRFLKSIGIRRIYLEGHSTGCQKITYYQYKRNDRNVKALILSAPADDYNIQRTTLGRKFGSTLRLANALYKKDRLAQMPRSYTARSFGAGRFISFSDLSHVEARLFNYESKKLREFGRVRQPILALFGNKDEHILKPAKEYMRILERDTGSVKFDYSIIKNADHGFDGKEDETANIIVRWLKGLEEK